MYGDTSQSTLLQQAIANHRTGHMEEAKTQYAAILQTEPDHPVANHNMGFIAVQQNCAEESLPYFVKAINADPTQGQYWLSYIDALFHTGQRIEARQVLELARQYGLKGAEVQKVMLRWVFPTSGDEKQHQKNQFPPENLTDRQEKLAAALHRAQVADYYYNIEVSGGCNLRCPSCGVGNTFVGGAAKTLMKLDLFTEIIKKIKLEQTLQGRNTICLDLYNWGEPLLNSELPNIVSLAKAEGFKVGISSNLNYIDNLEKLICAGPDYIRISVSGYFQETYSRTHKGGNIENVKANMRLLREYIDKHNVPTIVVVGYITYKHNCTDELLLMLLLCQELNFKFAKDTAVLMPMEKLLEAIEVQKIPAEIQDILPISPRLMSDLSRPFRATYQDCALRNVRLAINADGSVPLCCAVWGREFDVAGNYLETSEAEIRNARYKHNLCKRCMHNMADFTYNAIYVAPVIDEIRAALG